MHIGELEQAEAFVTIDGSTIRELAGAVSLPSVNQSLAEATVPVGAATTEHYHVVAEELYFFTAGSGRLRVGDDERDVRAGQCVVIPPGAPPQAVEHRRRAGRPAVLLLTALQPRGHGPDRGIAVGHRAANQSDARRP